MHGVGIENVLDLLHLGLGKLDIGAVQVLEQPFLAPASARQRATNKTGA